MPCGVCGCRLRAARGGVGQRTALSRDASLLLHEQHNRHAQHARGREKVRREAVRVRLQQLRVRRRAEPSEEGGSRGQVAFALCAYQASGRGVGEAVYAPLRASHIWPALFQRVREAPRPRGCVRCGNPALDTPAPRWRASHHQRGRVAEPRLHVCRERGGGKPEGVPCARVGRGRGVQRGLRRARAPHRRIPGTVPGARR